MIDAGLLRIHNGKTDVFTPSHGLSGGSVTAFVEDVEGNVWVATVDGLDRFREFAIPTISVQQGLSSRGVAALLAASDSSLWMGTSDGLNRWYQGQITIYRKRAMSGRHPAALFGGPTVWPGTQSKVTVREIRDSGLPADRVDSLFEDQLRQLWVGTYNGVAVFRSGRFSPVKSVLSGTIYAFPKPCRSPRFEELVRNALLRRIRNPGDCLHLQWFRMLRCRMSRSGRLAVEYW